MVILALSITVAFAGKRALFVAKIEEEVNIKLKFQTHILSRGVLLIIYLFGLQLASL